MDTEGLADQFFLLHRRERPVTLTWRKIFVPLVDAAIQRNVSCIEDILLYGGQGGLIVVKDVINSRKGCFSSNFFPSLVVSIAGTPIITRAPKSWRCGYQSQIHCTNILLKKMWAPGTDPQYICTVTNDRVAFRTLRYWSKYATSFFLSVGHGHRDSRYDVIRLLMGSIPMWRSRHVCYQTWPWGVIVIFFSSASRPEDQLYFLLSTATIV